MIARIALAATLLAVLPGAASSAGAGQNYTFRFGPSAGIVGGEANITIFLDVGAGEIPVKAWSLGVCHGPEVDIILVNPGGTTASIGPDFLNQQIFPGQGWTVGVVLSFTGFDTIPPGNGYALHVPRYALLAEGDAVLEFCDTLGSPPVATLITVANASSTTFPPIQVDGTISVGLIPPFICSFDPASAGAGEAVSLSLRVDNPVAFDGFAFGVTQPAGLLDIDAVTPGLEIANANGGLGPAFFGVNLAPAGGSGATAACLLSLTPPFAQIPAGTDREIAVIDGTISASAPDGAILPIDLTDTLGAPPVLTRFTIAGTSVPPIAESGAIEVSGGGGGTQFLRGDVNGDGTLTVGDGIGLASYLFAGTAAPGCLAASDIDDDDTLLIGDVIALLSYQFGGGPAPEPPFPACGADPTPGALTCDVPPSCP